VKKLVAFDVACNDPDNGHFAGRTASISMLGCEFEPSNFDGYKFNVEVDGTFRLHGKTVPFVSCTEWIGNWCWNRYWIRRSDAKALLHIFLKKNWHCVSGPARLCDWYDRKLAA